MLLSLVAAHDDKLGIGKDNDLPWHISTDLKRFKKLTMGQPLIMGRKTYDSIGRPLPGRTNIVITRDPDLQIEGCQVVASLEEAIERAQTEQPEHAFIIGGAQIYTVALPIADRLYMTEVQGDYGADTFFPEYRDRFKIIETSDWQTDGDITYRYVAWEK